MAGQGLKGIPRLIAAATNSMQGTLAAWHNEEAFRQECVLFVISVPLAFWLGETGLEKALLIGVMFQVLIVELLNSAVEAAIDRIGFERHELSGRAKDIGSAAVLYSLVQAFVVWMLVLFG